jgi:hypothetical protein
LGATHCDIPATIDGIGALNYLSDNTTLIPASALMVISNMALSVITSIGVASTCEAISTAIAPIAKGVFTAYLKAFARRSKPS